MKAMNILKLKQFAPNLISRQNIVFLLECSLFIVIVTGIFPRWMAIVGAVFFIMYVAIVPLQEGVVFFVRSIPLFLALPLTRTFDSFNTWRIISGVIFLKWLWLARLDGSWKAYLPWKSGAYRSPKIS